MLEDKFVTINDAKIHYIEDGEEIRQLFLNAQFNDLLAHDYRLYGRYMRILGIDSTFVKTFIKGSGNYKGKTMLKYWKLLSYSIQLFYLKLLF